MLYKLEEYYAIILNFQEPTLQERHWNDLKDILELPSSETDFFQSKRFSFGFLQNVKIENLMEKTSMVALQARKEHEIEQVCGIISINIFRINVSSRKLNNY